MKVIFFIITIIKAGRAGVIPFRMMMEVLVVVKILRSLTLPLNDSRGGAPLNDSRGGAPSG